MNSKAILILGIALSMILVACAPQEGEEGPDLTQPFIGGTVGLNTYLLEGVPPRLIQDNGQSPFSYAVVIENIGESDVGPGTNNPFFQARLQGINPPSWNLQDAQTVQVLNAPVRGARKNFDGTILPGEITTVSFDNMNYLDDVKGNTEFILRAELCYDYTTFSTTKLCIKDDVLENLQDTTICTLTGEKEPKNSGGPLHVTSLIQNPLTANKIQVRFVVEHVGIGEFYGRPGQGQPQETCNPSPSNFNKHNVHVRLMPISDQGFTITCPRFGGTADGTVKLWQGAPQTITCTIERTRQSQGRIFQDLLEVQLQYRYGQFIETPIIVQDVTNSP